MLTNLLLLAAAAFSSLLLLVFSYLDRVYMEMGRVAARRIRQNLERFETHVEPYFKMERKRAAFTFTLLAELTFAAAVVFISVVSIRLAETMVHAVLEVAVLITLVVIVVNRFVPYVLLLRTSGEWLVPLVPLVRLTVFLASPLRAGLEMAISFVHLAEEEEAKEETSAAEAIGELVEAGEEKGIIQSEDARLIESVVEFGDKIVREVMTPRPDIVSISADATIEELKRRLVETKFSRLPIYQGSLDDILGIVYDRDIFLVAEGDVRTRPVRDFVRQVQFVPETKPVSRLLKELQQAKQQMAIVIDEYGSVAGIVTIEDLVEEIIGDIRDEDESRMADVVKESESSYIVRGSTALERLRELLHVELRAGDATTVAGFVNAVLGHVPQAGETLTQESVRFEVLEANQRKVLRLRVVLPPQPQRHAAPAP